MCKDRKKERQLSGPGAGVSGELFHWYRVSQFREIKKVVEMNGVNVCSCHAAEQHVSLLNAIELYTYKC